MKVLDRYAQGADMSVSQRLDDSSIGECNLQGQGLRFHRVFP
jgi:hypothetical protein